MTAALGVIVGALTLASGSVLGMQDLCGGIDRNVSINPEADVDGGQFLRWHEHDTWKGGRLPCTCENAVVTEPVVVEDTTEARVIQLTVAENVPFRVQKGGTLIVTRERHNESCTVASHETTATTALTPSTSPSPDKEGSASAGTVTGIVVAVVAVVVVAVAIVVGVRHYRTKFKVHAKLAVA